jgi:hypothetical protein
MYIVVIGSALEFADFDYAWGPVGNLDVCKLVAPNLLDLGGWAGDLTPGHKIVDIQVLIDRDLVQRCLPFAPRPDVVAFFNNDVRFSSSGFSCTSRIPEHASESSALAVKLFSDSGLDTVIYHNPVGTVSGAG